MFRKVLPTHLVPATASWMDLNSDFQLFFFSWITNKKRGKYCVRPMLIYLFDIVLPIVFISLSRKYRYIRELEPFTIQVKKNLLSLHILTSSRWTKIFQSRSSNLLARATIKPLAKMKDESIRYDKGSQTKNVSFSSHTNWSQLLHSLKFNRRILESI